MVDVYLRVNIWPYLQGFQGGTSTFLNDDEDGGHEECVPQTGSILVFQHDILHEGSELINGRKYAVRTDVMYRPNAT